MPVSRKQDRRPVDTVQFAEKHMSFKLTGASHIPSPPDPNGMGTWGSPEPPKIASLVSFYLNLIKSGLSLLRNIICYRLQIPLGTKNTTNLAVKEGTLGRIVCIFSRFGFCYKTQNMCKVQCASLSASFLNMLSRASCGSGAALTNQSIDLSDKHTIQQTKGTISHC